MESFSNPAVKEFLFLAALVAVPSLVCWLIYDAVQKLFLAAQPPLPQAAVHQQRDDAEELRQLAERLRRRRRPAADIDPADECVICLEELTTAAAAVEPGQAAPRIAIELLPCSHDIHADCAVTLFTAPAFTRGGALCPTCRQPINIVVPAFHRHPTLDNITAFFPRELREFNRVGRIIRPGTVLSLAYWVVDNFARLPLVHRFQIALCAVLCMCYVLSPWDALSEAHFGVIGLADDVIVFLLSLVAVYHIVHAAFG